MVRPLLKIVKMNGRHDFHEQVGLLQIMFLRLALDQSFDRGFLFVTELTSVDGTMDTNT